MQHESESIEMSVGGQTVSVSLAADTQRLYQRALAGPRDYELLSKIRTRTTTSPEMLVTIGVFWEGWCAQGVNAVARLSR